METKFCNKCKTDKDIEDFSWRNKSKGIKLSWCKECMRNACNKIYRESDTRKNRIQQLNKESVNKNIKFINRYKELCGCAECKREDMKKHYLLDFHHRDPNEKEFDVATAHRSSLKTIKNEIRKCIVLCCRCHRTLHHKLKQNADIA